MQEWTDFLFVADLHIDLIVYYYMILKDISLNIIMLIIKNTVENRSRTKLLTHVYIRVQDSARQA